jgi:hypothetical protein
VTVAAGVVAGGDAGEASPAEVLAAALEANRELARLAGELREENARLRAENAGLAILKRMVFGRSSERSRPEAGAAGPGGSGPGTAPGKPGGKRGPGRDRGEGTAGTCRRPR